MSSGKHDIYIEQGSTFEMQLTCKDPGGVLIDLTGLTFTGAIKKKFTDVNPAALFEFTVLDQSAILTKGKVVCKIEPPQTLLLKGGIATDENRPLGHYFYDIESTSIDGEVNRWLEGNVSVSPKAGP